MSGLRMIEALCTLCEAQSRLIKAMALRLGELGDVALRDELAQADRLYCEIIGSDEPPAARPGRR